MIPNVSFPQINRAKLDVIYMAKKGINICFEINRVQQIELFVVNLPFFAFIVDIGYLI